MRPSSPGWSGEQTRAALASWKQSKKEDPSNRLLSRATISDAIGFNEEPESSRAVDIRIMRLRKKIEDDPSNPKFLRTVRGEGYIFSLPEEGR